MLKANQLKHLFSSRFFVLMLAVLMQLLVPLPVRSNDEAALQEKCGEGTYQDKARCYQKGLELILKTHGTERALTVLEKLASQDPDVLRDAHPYTHHLGRASFAHYQDAQAAFSHCRAVFWSGCYHGVLEGYLQSLSQVAPRDVATLCSLDIEAEPSRFLRYQCLHGLGHGLTRYFQHDVPKALSFCDALPSTWQRESCYGGVFMENIVTFQNSHQAHHGHHTHQADSKQFLDPQDPLYPCNAIEKRYQQACYLMQSSAILIFTKHNFAQAFQACATAPSAFTPICYQSLGREISGFTLRNPEKIRALCERGSPEAVGHCLVGAVKDMMMTHADPHRGFAFCRRIEESAKKACYTAAGEVLFALDADPERRKAVCMGIEEAYVTLCKASAYAF